MKETRTINLGGLVFHIDNDAYQSLSSYLQDIELRLSADERVEVMADIESRISELLQKALFARNVQVIDITMIHAVQEQMGAPSEFGENKRPRVKHTTSNQRSGCGRIAAISLAIGLMLMALPVLIPVCVAVLGVIVALLGVGVATMPALGVGLFGGSIALTSLLLCSGMLVMIIPVIMLIHSIINWMRTRKAPSARFWWITISLWVLSIIGTGILMNRMSQELGGWKTMLNTLSMWDEDEDQSESRTIAPFNRIQVKGDVEVDIKPGENYSLLVSSNRLPSVTTEVQDSVLYITLPDDRYTDAEVSIMLPTLKSIDAIGDCHVRADVNTDSLTASLTGAGQLNLEGTAHYVDLRITGAGKVEAEWLNAQVMHVNCMGASKAELYVEKELWAQALGASKITYKGNPIVKQKMAVGGSSIRKD